MQSEWVEGGSAYDQGDHLIFCLNWDALKMQVQQAKPGTALYKPNYDIANPCQLMGSPGWPSGSQDSVELISHLYGIHDLPYNKDRDSGNTQLKSPQVSTERSVSEQECDF